MKNEQLALLRADINTGTILDEDYINAATSDQKVYAVFDNLDSAKKNAKAIISERKDIE